MKIMVFHTRTDSPEDVNEAINEIEALGYIIGVEDVTGYPRIRLGRERT